MNRRIILTTIFMLFVSVTLNKSSACTNFIITKGASTDGSIMVTYSADSHVLYGALYNSPKATYPKGAMLSINEWDTGAYKGEIPQVSETYSTIGNMNEHQVVISETTYGGREELQDSTGVMDYGSLIYVTLQRAKTAREAIQIVADLANAHGYASSGESFSIADANEAWIMELIGKGCELNSKGINKNRGIVWVARKVPDGYISAHANQARITQFPLNDPENCMYSKDVIKFARDKGYFNGKDADFSFSDTYAPLDFGAMRACEARVWSFFNMFTTGMDQYLDYAMGHNQYNKMPLWLKPTNKISPKETFDAMRDHYEGTAMDMTTDVGAGGEECPYRWRPMSFEVDGKTYVNERAIATQQAGFWFVTQSRSWLPDEVGGIIWFGVDDPGTSSLTPIYSSATEVPECFKVGNGHMTKYSPTAAFWVYNRVAQFAYLRYNVIGKKVQEVATQWELEQLAEVERVDARAEIMSAEEAVPFLTKFSVDRAQEMFQKWVELDIYLLVKYMDGNVKKEDENGFIDNGNGVNMPVSPEWPGYSDEWKRAVVEDAGETLKQMPVKQDK